MPLLNRSSQPTQKKFTPSRMSVWRDRIEEMCSCILLMCVLSMCSHYSLHVVSEPRLHVLEPKEITHLFYCNNWVINYLLPKDPFPHIYPNLFLAHVDSQMQKHGSWMVFDLGSIPFHCFLTKAPYLILGYDVFIYLFIEIELVA